MQNTNVDIVWEENPEFIRKFHDNKPKYESLCQEVHYILKQRLQQESIEVAAVSSRAKTQDSFCEKLCRKDYPEPFSEMTDFAGARVVYLYSSDRPTIEEIIENEFEIIEKTDKVSSNEDDQFGYGALHYLVRLKSNYNGARYEGINTLTCEVQVRTILQDAWAVVAHHLSYKQESDVPKPLRRKLNALSGLFETADDQFENIKSLREKYHQTVTKDIRENSALALNEELELDNLSAYLSLRYPERDSNEKSESIILRDLKQYNLTTLEQLDGMLRKTEKAFAAYENKYPPAGTTLLEYQRVGVVRISFEMTNANYASRNGSRTQTEYNRREEFKELIE